MAVYGWLRRDVRQAPADVRCSSNSGSPVSFLACLTNPDGEQLALLRTPPQTRELRVSQVQTSRSRLQDASNLGRPRQNGPPCLTFPSCQPRSLARLIGQNVYPRSRPRRRPSTIGPRNRDPKFADRDYWANGPEKATGAVSVRSLGTDICRKVAVFRHFQRGQSGSPDTRKKIGRRTRTRTADPLIKSVKVVCSPPFAPFTSLCITHRKHYIYSDRLQSCVRWIALRLLKWCDLYAT